jgi:tetratricopeptide (TPR) repeat protein
MGSTLLLVLAQLASPGPASPRELFEEGAALFEKGEFVRAAEKFEASFELRPLPVAKFNAARSWEKANKTLNAVGAWQAWLAASPATAPQRAEVETALAALGEKLAKQGVQAFTITSLPSGARVSLDGQARGRTPVTVEIGRAHV